MRGREGGALVAGRGEAVREMRERCQWPLWKGGTDGAREGEGLGTREGRSSCSLGYVREAQPHGNWLQLGQDDQTHQP